MATQTIYAEKVQAVTDTPLLIFDCTLVDGTAEHWSTHAVTVNGTAYAARVLQQNVFQMQMASSQGVDGIPGISVTLANADSYFSEIERATGCKGALLTVTFLFYDLRNDVPATDTQVVFQGICNPPDERREATFRISAGNRMSLQRLLLPEVRIQRRCPWKFPATAAEQTEAIDGGANGKYSLYYRCGYSAGQTGGSGNLNGGAPFTACGYVRADCQARGMWLNFGGIEFVPPAIAVRTYGKELSHLGGLGERGAVQRLRADGVRHGMVRAAGGVRAQRRQPDADGSAAGNRRDAGRADGAGERHRDSAGRGGHQHDRHGLVQHSDAGDARRAPSTPTSRMRAGSRRATLTAAWRTCRWWCRTS